MMAEIYKEAINPDYDIKTQVDPTDYDEQDDERFYIGEKELERI